MQSLPVPDRTYRNLAALEFARGDLDAAATYMDRAFAASKIVEDALPEWVLHYDRAQIRAKAGDHEGALNDLRSAVDHANRLRLDLLPAESVRVGAGVGLRSLYAGYVDLANEAFNRDGDAALIRDSFEVAEQSRAIALRESLHEMDTLRDRLPAEYWEIMDRLSAAEQQRLDSEAQDSDDEIARLRHRLTLLEVEAGLEAGSFQVAPIHASVSDVQASLSGSEALLAFHLGEPRSYLWTVTSESIGLHNLPGRTRIDQSVRAFRSAVERSMDSAKPLGQKLYNELFPGLSASVKAKEDWVLLLDGVLFELPFAALRTDDLHLIERHSLRIVPSAAMLGVRNPGSWSGPAAFVADTIYNTADPRWTGGRGDADGSRQMARLAGSRREVANCSELVRAGVETVVLDGQQATIASLRNVLRRQPGILHFATHVLADPEDGGTGFVALSLSDQGRLEVLGPNAIRALSAKAGLVTMSGCSSGSGKVLPGEGLFGLTRAWLRAGARNVAATLWPTPDSSGELLREFYGRLAPEGERGFARPPHEALRLAQIEMIKAGGWRSKSGYWAAYFLVGRE
jgi:CHAT domain-containing protein